MKKIKLCLLQGNSFYSHVFKQNLHNLGYSDISLFKNASAMLENLNNPPDVIIYDFDVDCFGGEEIVKSLSRAFPNAYLLFGCFLEESYLIPKFLQCGATNSFIKDQHEMKSVENLLENISREKIQAEEKFRVNVSQNKALNVV
jgi:hypothetical protein